MKEKLSIEEIIAHCERTVSNLEKYRKPYLEDISNIDAKEYWEHRQVKGYLEELQKYREIGTPEELNRYMNQSEEEFNMLAEYLGIGTIEECREAVEKRKPFRPDQENLIAGVGRCKCGAEFLDRSTAYCGNCGQKLDWGGGKDCQNCS